MCWVFLKREFEFCQPCDSLQSPSPSACNLRNLAQRTGAYSGGDKAQNVVFVDHSFEI